MNEKEIRLEELSKNEEFIAKLHNVESIEDAISLFAKFGVSVTEQEITDLKNSFSAEELGEMELENIAGGELKIMYKCECGMYFIHKAIAKQHAKAWGYGHQTLPGKYSPFLWF